MKEKLRLSITKNYQSITKKIFFALFTPVIPLGLLAILLEKNVFSVQSITVLIVFVIICLPFMIYLIISINKSYFVDNLWFEDDGIATDENGKIKYDEIVSFKEFHFRAHSIIILQMKKGEKIAFAPSGNFSKKAINEYYRFMELIKKYN